MSSKSWQMMLLLESEVAMFARCDVGEFAVFRRFYYANQQVACTGMVRLVGEGSCLTIRWGILFLSCWYFLLQRRSVTRMKTWIISHFLRLCCTRWIEKRFAGNKIHRLTLLLLHLCWEHSHQKRVGPAHFSRCAPFSRLRRNSAAMKHKWSRGKKGEERTLVQHPWASLSLFARNSCIKIAAGTDNSTRNWPFVTAEKDSGLREKNLESDGRETKKKSAGLEQLWAIERQ